MKVNGFTIKRALRIQGRQKSTFPTPLKGRDVASIGTPVEETVQAFQNAAEKFDADVQAYVAAETFTAALQGIQASYNASVLVPYSGTKVSLAFLIRLQGVYAKAISALPDERVETMTSFEKAARECLSCDPKSPYWDNASDYTLTSEHVAKMKADLNRRLLTVENAIAEGNSRMVDLSRLSTLISDQEFTQILSGAE